MVYGYKLTMIRESGECRNRSQSNEVVIVIQHRDEPWNGSADFFAKFDFIPALAISE